ncbi:hypothetical protein Tco_0566714 [Tanacetum coccineum]
MSKAEQQEQSIAAMQAKIYDWVDTRAALKYIADRIAGSVHPTLLTVPSAAPMLQAVKTGTIFVTIMYNLIQKLNWSYIYLLLFYEVSSPLLWLKCSIKWEHYFTGGFPLLLSFSEFLNAFKYVFTSSTLGQPGRAMKQPFTLPLSLTIIRNLTHGQEAKRIAGNYRPPIKETIAQCLFLMTDCKHKLDDERDKH